MSPRYGFGLMMVLGLAAPALACQVPYNLVQNCGFALGTAGWENETPGNCVSNNTGGVTDAANITCSSYAGAIGHVVRFRQCIENSAGVAGNRLYAYGAHAQLVSGSSVNCNVQAADWSQDSCMFNINAATTPLAPAGSYVVSTPATYLTGANALSAHVRVECFSATAFQIRVDDVFFVDELIFADGFE